MVIHAVDDPYVTPELLEKWSKAAAHVFNAASCYYLTLRIKRLSFGAFD